MLKMSIVVAAHQAAVDKFNALPVPTLEALVDMLRTNRWFCAVVQKAAKHRARGFEGGVCAEPASFDDHYLRQLEYDDLVSVVPFVRRLGYPVILFSNEDQGHPFNIACAAVQSSDFILGKDCTNDFEEHVQRGEPYPIRLHGTSPEQIRRRGLLKCVPRLLGMLRAARIALANPNRPGVLDAIANELDTIFDRHAPDRERNAAEQTGRKRKLAEALHASEYDTREGARWADIQVHDAARASRLDAPVRPMRIEAVAGEHYIFQHNDNEYDPNYEHKVRVLHRDAFDVRPLPDRDWFENFFEQRFYLP